jgi:rod shape-determining protein MreD
MRRVLVPFLLSILFITLQATLLASSPIQRIRPDIVLILTLYLGLSYPPISGGILAFVIGYLMDVFSGNSFGLYAFSRPLLFYVAQFFRGRLYLEGYSSQFLFVFLFALVEGLLVLILLTALNPTPLGNLYPLLFSSYLPQSVFTGLIAPTFFLLFNKGSVLLFRQPGMRTKERG